MESPDPKLRLRPRISLLSLLLLTALVACGIVIAIQTRELGPLRQEVTRLRIETGQLTIIDPEKIYITRLESSDELTWKWRVYLPTGTQYDLRTLVGRVRGRAPGTSRREWFDACGANCSSPLNSNGEFVVTVALRPDNDSDQRGSWNVLVDYSYTSTPKVKHGVGCGRRLDWMDGFRSRGFHMGDAIDFAQQHEFDASQGLELLTLLRTEVTENTSGWSTNTPDRTKENDGVAVWLVPRKPSLTSSGTTKPLPTPPPPR